MRQARICYCKVNEMKLKKKHHQLRAHYEKFIDRYRWPDYVFTDNDLILFINYESNGTGNIPEPLLWAKKTEEITLQQMWHEMADAWASGFGWWSVWRSNLSNLWNDRRGNGIFVKKCLAQARHIKRHRRFIDAMLSCSYFTNEDKERYCSAWICRNPSPAK